MTVALDLDAQLVSRDGRSQELDPRGLVCWFGKDYGGPFTGRRLATC